MSSICTKEMAYQHGVKNIPLNKFCLDLEIKDELKASYKLGIEKQLRVESSMLEAKAAKLSKKIKALKGSFLTSFHSAKAS